MENFHVKRMKKYGNDVDEEEDGSNEYEEPEEDYSEE